MRFALNGKRRTRVIIFCDRSLKILAQIYTLWSSPPFFLPSFPSSFRSKVQRIVFICQPLTEHCSTLCSIHQRDESSMEWRSSLDHSLTFPHSCINLCRLLSSCLFYCIVSFPSSLVQAGCLYKSLSPLLKVMENTWIQLLQPDWRVLSPLLHLSDFI